MELLMYRGKLSCAGLPICGPGRLMPPFVNGQFVAPVLCRFSKGKPFKGPVILSNPLAGGSDSFSHSPGQEVVRSFCKKEPALTKAVAQTSAGAALSKATGMAHAWLFGAALCGFMMPSCAPLDVQKETGFWTNQVIFEEHLSGF